MSLIGVVDPGEYRLVLRPQPLAERERFRIEVVDSPGAVQAGLVGVLEGPSVLDRTGLSTARRD